MERTGAEAAGRVLALKKLDCEGRGDNGQQRVGEVMAEKELLRLVDQSGVS